MTKNGETEQDWQKFCGRTALAFLLCVCVLTATPVSRPALACDDCDQVDEWHGDDEGTPLTYDDSQPCETRDTIRCLIRDEHQITTDHILAEFDDQEEFIQEYFWPIIFPALPMMTEQFAHTAMAQMMILGAMIDGKQQMETQAIFQKLTAEAHRDYQPSVDMCVIGTNVRSLAAAERNAEYTAYIYSQRNMDRELGNLASAAARGGFDDDCLRLRQFRARYCDLHDNNDHMNLICNPDPDNLFFPECFPGKDNINISDETKNKDISFTRTVDRAKTLDIDFYTNPGLDTLSSDEQDTFALASNLYAPDVTFRPVETNLNQRETQDALLDIRSVAAKRAVAEHSYNTIVGMKALGTEESANTTYPYMKILLEGLGFGSGGDSADEQLAVHLGQRPSYNAQMEVLTKRIFQSPNFFTDLYDEPANTARKSVSLQAIDLMQSFDLWNSSLRTEALLSVVLELELLRLDRQVENQRKGAQGGGIRL